MPLFEKLIYSFSEKKTIPQQFPILLNNDQTLPPLVTYNMTRVMPIVRKLASRSFMIFPSVQSYDIFKQKKGDSIDPEGMGIPLFEAVPSLLPTYIDGRPLLKISKFVLLPRDAPAPSSQYEIITQDDNYNLFKIPFCEVYYKLTGVASRRYEFQFSNPEILSPNYIQSEAFSYSHRGTAEGFDLNWDISRIPFLVGKLVITVKQDTPPTYQNAVKGEKKQKPSSYNYKTKTCAYYTKRFQDEVPKLISRRADLIIGELNNSHSLGITNVSIYTEIFACHALMIHELEHTRNNKSEKRNRRIDARDIKKEQRRERKEIRREARRHQH
ncbi:Uncharacterized protein AO441_003542 [Nakaseomyces glabratus]|uniref:Uncharacterized protein n=1 Tax=Candida glabrata TaxID=5478 RepID=A0A0W0CSS1_CANGB|nr:Uncharacterized protein AO440_003603 [Nakaseomyces glabratus]KTB07801.1 Uncharacterized protein AO439_003673 [Nakaseomyces glabratus]KTB10087.1 Uncharacterized protein AO441_003542 [Nakaseomyces glabratus]KTB23967.1 Uncharacterized protein AO438_003698 [Nakaseomyces glabratus]UCS22389.1 uncharacterized protein GW608_K08129 [Nakaseomyces glabratus]